MKLYFLLAAITIFYACSDSVDPKKKQTRDETSDLKIDHPAGSFVEDSLAIGLAKEKFDTYCTQCHGNEGQGLIGPNLTDAYWIHGRKIEDIIRILREGVPEKGMVAWTNLLADEEIQRVANYVLSLGGSKPPNPKGPEGQLYTEEGELVSGSQLIVRSFDPSLTGLPLDGDTSRGQKLFNGSFGCARCHGRDIQGLTDNRDLKRMAKRYGPEAGLVFDLVTKNGRTGTAMPPWNHLSKEDLMDLKTFIFSIQVEEIAGK